MHLQKCLTFGVHINFYYTIGGFFFLLSVFTGLVHIAGGYLFVDTEYMHMCLNELYFASELFAVFRRRNADAFFEAIGKMRRTRKPDGR